MQSLLREQATYRPTWEASLLLPCPHLCSWPDQIPFSRALNSLVSSLLVLYLLVLVFPWPPSLHLSRSYWLPPSWTTNRRLRWQTWCYLDLDKPGLSNLLWKRTQRRYARHIRVALCFFGGDGWLDGGTWRGWRVRRGAREFSSRCTRNAASRSSS